MPNRLCSGGFIRCESGAHHAHVRISCAGYLPTIAGVVVVQSEGEEVVVSTSSSETSAFDIAATKDDAERSHRWIVMQNDECVGVYDSREDALTAATRRFGKVPVVASRVDDRPTVIRPMFGEMSQVDEHTGDIPLFVSAHSVVE